MQEQAWQHGRATFEWIDREGRSTPLWEETQETRNPRFSPDRTRIAFDLARAQSVRLEVFDLRPGALIRDLELLNTSLVQFRPTAAYGHFGRTDIDLPWEKTDLAEKLKKEALG